MSSVDHELLADYVGGALSGTPQNDYVAHLVATSPQWRAAAEEMTAALESVSRDLAVLRDTPEEMPADIVARFDELLAPPKRDPLAARPVRHRGARKRKWKRWAAPIAVAAAALTFFGLGQVPRFATNFSQDTANAPGRSSSEMAPQADAPAAASAGVPTIYTGNRYRKGDLSSRVADKSGAPLTFGQESVRDRTAWQRFDQPEARSACLNAVAAVLPGRPTQVEFAYYEDKPALVISITTFSGKWLFFAGTSCGLTGADELDRAPHP